MDPFTLIYTAGGAISAGYGVFVSTRFKVRKVQEQAANDRAKAIDDAAKSVIFIREDQIKTLEIRIAEITKERDWYRDEKHSLASKCQAAELRVQELESLPNLSELITLFQSHQQNQAAANTKLFELIEKVNAKLDRELHSVVPT